MEGASDTFPLSKFNEISSLHIKPLFIYLNHEQSVSYLHLRKAAIFVSSHSDSTSILQAPLQEPGLGMPPMQRGYVQQERLMKTLQPAEMPEPQSQLYFQQLVQDQRAWQAQVGSQTGKCVYPQMQNLQNPHQFSSSLGHQGIQGEKSQQMGKAQMPMENVNEMMHHQELKGNTF